MDQAIGSRHKNVYRHNRHKQLLLKMLFQVVKSVVLFKVICSCTCNKAYQSAAKNVIQTYLHLPWPW